MAFISRPRFGSAEKHALTRAEAPETYRLLDDISTALGAPRIASIALDGDWNAGTYHAAVSSLERLTLHGAYARAVSAVAIARRPAADVFAELDAQISITPASELERLRRLEARDPFRFDQSHPPLSQRITVLGQSATQPTLLMSVSPARMRAIDAEFAPAEPRIARDLVEEHHASMS